MCWGAAANDKNGCERTRKRDRDSQTPMRDRGEMNETTAADKALGDPPPDPLGFSACVPIPKGEKAGRHKAAPSVLAPGSALGSVPTVALSSAQVKRNCIMPSPVPEFEISPRACGPGESFKKRHQDGLA